MRLVSVQSECDASGCRANDFQAAANNQPDVLLKHNGDTGFNRQSGSIQHSDGSTDVVRAVRCVPYFVAAGGVGQRHASGDPNRCANGGCREWRLRASPLADRQTGLPLIVLFMK